MRTIPHVHGVGGTIDGRYQVLSVLGEGGMGAVYEVRHVRTGRHVALKVIRAQVSGNDEMVKRFQREARLSGSLETPHVVNVFDTGTDPATGLLYMAMELLKGEDLQKLLKRCTRLRPELAVRIIGQACLGLTRAHEAGVLHRDIKPANLFLSELEDRKVIVKIVDFGIAKAVSLRGFEESSLTRTGGMLGSPHYMSPEQTKGSKDIDHRSDIWSLGVVLYQALTGRTPHVRQDTPLELMVRICSQPAPPIQDFAPWVPPGLALVVHRMLTMHPEGRYQRAEEVLEALGPWLPDGLDVVAEELVPLPEAEAAQTAPRATLPCDATTAHDAASFLARVALELQAQTPAPVDEATAARARPSSPEDDVDDGALTQINYRASLPPLAPASHPGPHVEPPASSPSIAEAPAISASLPALYRSPDPVVIHRDDATPVSQGAATLPTRAQRPRVRLMVAIPAALALGVAGQLLYGLVNRPAIASTDDPAPAIPTAAAAPKVASADLAGSAAARPPPVEERTVRLAVEPLDAKVELDGQPAEVRDGAIELRGALGSVHSVRLVKGSQEATAGVAITPVGALPARVRIEPSAAPPPKRWSPALNRKFE